MENEKGTLIAKGQDGKIKLRTVAHASTAEAEWMDTTPKVQQFLDRVQIGEVEFSMDYDSAVITYIANPRTRYNGFKKPFVKKTWNPLLKNDDRSDAIASAGNRKYASMSVEYARKWADAKLSALVTQCKTKKEVEAAIKDCKEGIFDDAKGFYNAISQIVVLGVAQDHGVPVMQQNIKDVPKVSKTVPTVQEMDDELDADLEVGD